MKRLSEYCNEAMKNPNFIAAEEIDKKIQKWVDSLKKNKDYDLKNPYAAKLRVGHGGARIEIEEYYDTTIKDDIRCFPTNDMRNYSIEGTDVDKSTKTLVKFFSVIILASNGHTSYEGTDLFTTTGKGEYRNKESIWYSPDKDQLFDANFKKISKPGNVAELREECGKDFDDFVELFCGCLAGMNEKTKYTKEWFK